MRPPLTAMHFPITFKRGLEAEFSHVEARYGRDIIGLDDGVELGAFHGFHPLLKKYNLHVNEHKHTGGMHVREICTSD